MTRKTLKLTVAGAIFACAAGVIALGVARATPPSPGFVSTPIAGPALFDEIHTVHQTPDWGVMIHTRGLSDIYFTHFKLAPGAHGGWHSHPGPSIIAVRSGTATFYDDCNDFVPLVYPAGTGFVEDAGCVHLLANEGNVDLEVVVMQIVPRRAPRRIDEANPFDPIPSR
ncbi:MAG TPA: cupin domain-containing protein [Gemmataceae bacterium]|nr:cupin domain-containing protein [Gemmataceae bacterium]